MNRLKRVVIKQELVELTEDFKKAILLNQLIYWSERVKDFDNFIKEENKRMNNNDIDDKPLPLQYGWIYKKAEELSEETMMGLSKQTIGRLLDDLCSSKWIEKRRNPKYKWDKTYQYRVNLMNIAIDLYRLGYILQDYKIDINKLIPSSKMELQDINLELCNNKNGTAIPEITTENTITEIISYKGVFNNTRIISFNQFIDIYYQDNLEIDEYIVNSMLYFLNKRKSLLKTNEPKYQYNTWLNLYENWFTLYREDRETTSIGYDESIEMIDRFFNTEFKDKDCDYSIVLYSQNRIKELRYMECDFM